MEWCERFECGEHLELLSIEGNSELTSDTNTAMSCGPVFPVRWSGASGRIRFEGEFSSDSEIVADIETDLTVGVILAGLISRSRESDGFDFVDDGRPLHLIEMRLGVWSCGNDRKHCAQSGLRSERM
jgi:hypothetical protein